MRKEKGFTLVELLVVMAIIGILIALAIAGLNIARRNARDTTRKADAQNLRILLEDYYLTAKRYPLPSEMSTTSAPGIKLAYTGGSTKDVEFEYGGELDLQTTTCNLTDPSPRDELEICYSSTGSRPQSYTLSISLEGGGTFDVTTEE